MRTEAEILYSRKRRQTYTSAVARISLDFWLPVSRHHDRSLVSLCSRPESSQGGRVTVYYPVMVSILMIIEPDQANNARFARSPLNRSLICSERFADGSTPVSIMIIGFCVNGAPA